MRPLLLTALCLALPARALSPLDDNTLADTTGQAGLTLRATLNSPANTTGGTGNDFTYVDTDGATGMSTATAVNLRNFGLSASLTATFDAGATTGKQADAVLNLSLNSALTLSFTAAWPNSSTPAGLGVGIMDMCANPASGPCAPGGSGDYPFLMAPSTGVSWTLSANGTQMALQLGAPLGAMAILSDTSTATLTISGSGTGVNMALIDSGNVTSVGSTVGGLGLHSLSVTGLDWGESSSTSNDTSIYSCSATASATCTAAKTGGGAGLLMSFGGAAMTAVNIVANGVTLGNVGSTSSGNGVGLMEMSNLSLANTSILISGH